MRSFIVCTGILVVNLVIPLALGVAEHFHPDLKPLLLVSENGVDVSTATLQAGVETDGSAVRVIDEDEDRKEETDEDDENDEAESELQCGLVRDLTHEGGDADATSAPVRECCRVGNAANSDKFEVKCLPSFIIAGTQKSGTTVLSAFLANHPSVSFARKKELHFFSNDKYYKKGLVSGYLDYFKRWNFTETDWSLRPPYYGEATPYYLASRKACPRIAKTIGGDLRLIVLLREPAARAYSEYQMKIRRVEQQNEFIGLCDLYARDVYNCLSQEDSYSPDSSGSKYWKIHWKSLKQCMPAPIREHFHWSKLVSALEDHATKKEAWTDILNECFSLKQHENEHGEEGDSDGHGAGDESLSQLPEFRAKACLRKHARERVSPVEEAFFTEIDAFHRCAQNESKAEVPSEEFYSYGVGSPGELDRQVDRCLHVKSGISSQYVYRSLYVVQLYHCLKHFDRSQLLVVPSERLRADPQAVYERVLRFIGVDVKKEGVGHLPVPTPSGGASSGGDDGAGESSHSYESVSEEDAVTEAVKKNFPVFERNTGWRLFGEYAPMEERDRQRLREYFRPFNEMLFEFLGERYPEWD